MKLEKQPKKAPPEYTIEEKKEMLYWRNKEDKELKRYHRNKINTAIKRRFGR